MHSIRGQIVFEFIFWVGLALSIGVVLLVLMAGMLHDEMDNRRYDQYEDLAITIRDELVLASEVNPGYERHIYVINSSDYNLTIANSFLVISYQESQINLRIPRINGTVMKGNNTIRNINGEVFVTQNG